MELNRLSGIWPKVSTNCVIGGYFKEHAITVFGLMQEDPRMKLARQILEYMKRHTLDNFKARDVIRHTAIQLAEDAEKGIGILRERGYVRQEENTSTPGVGRPEAETYRLDYSCSTSRYPFTDLK